MTYYKGFDKDLRCRGMQFEVGKTYDTGAKDEDVELCSDTAIHFCDSLQNVHGYYSQNPDANNRVCEVEPLGKTVSNNTKMGTNKIKILREITGEELAHLRGLERGNTGVFNTGCQNIGYWNTGDQNTGDGNTGSQNTGSKNTGYQNTGYWNTGSQNPGDYNVGNCNTGDQNTGYGNTGKYNTGNLNSGYWNTGSRNSGNLNTGDFNKTNYSTGFFNTKECTVTIFNMDSGMTYNEFVSSKFYKAICSSPFALTEWHEFTEAEMKDSPSRQDIGGKLIQHTYGEACANWWKNMTPENKEIIKSMPNFDAEIFKEITGISV